MATCAACGSALPGEARFCPSCGASVDAPTAVEERKLATVLFADLVGSTELGEQDPERTRALLAGERTVGAVRGAFEFGDPATIRAKGKEGAVECRRVVRALTLMRPRGVGDLRRTFVGRDDELAQLQAAYDRAVEHGEPQLV